MGYPAPVPCPRLPAALRFPFWWVLIPSSLGTAWWQRRPEVGWLECEEGHEVIQVSRVLQEAVPDYGAGSRAPWGLSQPPSLSSHRAEHKKRLLCVPVFSPPG